MYWCSPVLVKDSPYTRFLKQITLDFTKGVSMDNLAKNNVKIKPSVKLHLANYHY